MMQTLIDKGKADEKDYEKREEARAVKERAHQLEMIKLLMGGGQATL
jgi:hypothetical protein|tara:strand:+ start:46 stop:186 length:141 start_codon:yes stop_codon:yes gene_type:complete